MTDETTKETEKRLYAILREHTWNDAYHLVEIKGKEFIIFFEDDDDAARFQEMMHENGASCYEMQVH